MVMSDPNATKAAAAMSVDIGAVSGPVAPGLAHFLERMPFLGTSKYAAENASAARRDIRHPRGSRWRQLRRPASAPRRLPTGLPPGGSSTSGSNIRRSGSSSLPSSRS
ncbi:unnamed protein product [Ectocarpus sp. 12 AP-2014]